MARSAIRASHVVAIACMATAVTTASARGAADARTEKAREHYLQGNAFYKLDRYASALQEYEQAYLAKPDPSFLYNIAQCHRLMGAKPEAIKFYRRYLQDAPNAPNREVAEKHIKDLEAALAAPVTPPPPAAMGTPPRSGPGASPTVLPALPPPVTGPGSVAPPPPPQASMPAPRPVTPPATALALSAPPPPAPDAPSGGTLAAPPPGSRDDGQQPIYAKWWFWTGVGVVVVGGLLLALSAKSDPSCPAGRTCQ